MEGIARKDGDVEPSEKNLEQEHRGRELHREFIGMLFALAISEVAIQAAGVANNPSMSHIKCIPTYVHLFLASLLIAASWVGWGWSLHSLSNVRNIFTLDFFELLVDLWLVAVYFFIVKGVELPDAQGNVVASLENETFWIMVVFGTYFLWNLLTKRLKRDKESGSYVIIQRGWASLVCMILAIVAFYCLPRHSSDRATVLLGDLSLVFLILLFRAMKISNLSKIKKVNIILIGAISALFLVTIACASSASTPWVEVRQWIAASPIS